MGNRAGAILYAVLAVGARVVVLEVQEATDIAEANDIAERTTVRSIGMMYAERAIDQHAANL